MKSAGGSPPASQCDWAEPALSFEELLRRNTGWAQTPERWQQQRRRRQLLEAETARIADALEAEGIRVRLGGGDIVALGDITGLVAPVESFRATRILPTIAQRDRRSMLNALRYYRRHNPFGSYLRLVVVTSGQRVPLGGDLRGRMRRMHRKASRFAHEARERFGVEVVYRGTEFTVDEVLSFHVHANLLLAPRGMLPPGRWQAFLSWMHRFFGAHVHDAGRLLKPEEAIKYPFKPADLERLEGPALAWVYRETRGLKLAQPLGDFAEFWRALKHGRLKVLLVDGPDGAKLCLVEKPKRPVSLGDRRSRRGGDQAAPENEIICQMAPQARFCPRAEPVTLVRNYTPNPKTWKGLLRLEEIKELRRRARAGWDANGAPDPTSMIQSQALPQLPGSAQCNSENGLRSGLTAGAGAGLSAPAAAGGAGTGGLALPAKGVRVLATSPNIPTRDPDGRTAPGLATSGCLTGTGFAASGGDRRGAAAGVRSGMDASSLCSSVEGTASTRSISAMARTTPGRNAKEVPSSDGIFSSSM